MDLVFKIELESLPNDSLTEKKRSKNVSNESRWEMKASY